jgi:hypothetical protein
VSFLHHHICISVYTGIACMRICLCMCALVHVEVVGLVFLSVSGVSLCRLIDRNISSQ